MPIWNDPPRRLIDAIRRIRKENAERKGEQIELAEIEGVQARDTFLVRGRSVRTTSDDPGLRVGQVVPIVTKQGEPKAILAHSARRAQLPPGVNAGAPRSIIEELLIAESPQADPPVTKEVWFRNDLQVSNLNIVGSGALQGHDPIDIAWGRKRDSFVVVTGDAPVDRRYYVFTIKRTPDRVLSQTPPVVTFQGVKLYKDVDTILATMSFKFVRDSNEAIPQISKFTPSGGGSSVSFLGLNRYFDRAQVTRIATLRLQNGAINVAGGNTSGTATIVTVSSPSLSDSLKVYVTVRIRLLNFAGNPGAGGATGSRQNIQDGPDLGCPITTVGAPVQDFTRFSGFIAPYFNFTQEHIALVNVTDGTIVWSTLQSGTFQSTEELSGWRQPINALPPIPTQNIIPDAFWAGIPVPFTEIVQAGGSPATTGQTCRQEFFPNPSPPPATLLFDTNCFYYTGSGSPTSFGYILKIDYAAGIEFPVGVPVPPGGTNTAVIDTPGIPLPTKTVFVRYNDQFKSGPGGFDPSHTSVYGMKRSDIAAAVNATGVMVATVPIDAELMRPETFSLGEEFRDQTLIGGNDAGGGITNCIAIASGSGAISTPGFDSVEVGFTGIWGVSQSQSSLYSGLIPTVDPSLLIAIKKQRIHWSAVLDLAFTIGASYDLGSVVARYSMFFTARPFYAKDGAVKTFVAVTAVALKPTGVPEAASDVDQAAAYVLTGDQLTHTLREMGPSDSKEADLMAASGKRLLWTFGPDVFMTDLARGITKQVGDNDVTFRSKLAAWLTNPDFLFNDEIHSVSEPDPDKVAAGFFVNGWNRTTGAITLTQNPGPNEPEFPPHDTKLALVAGQKTLPKGMRDTIAVADIQTVNDKSILSPLGVNLTDA